MHEPEIARRWSHEYGRTAVPNKRGNKGSTGAAKGFSTHHQAGTKGAEDSPGWDPRTQGDRRYGAGARLPGGKKSKYGNISRDAIAKRLTKSKKRKRTEDEGDRSTYADTENYKGGHVPGRAPKGRFKRSA